MDGSTASSSVRCARHEDRLDRARSPFSTRRAPTPMRRSPSPNASPSRWRRERRSHTRTSTSRSSTTALTYAADGPAGAGSQISLLGRPRGRQAADRHRRAADRPRSTARRSSKRLRDGAFDGASVQRDRVFMTALGSAADRRRDAVQGPRVDRRLGRAHQRARSPSLRDLVVLDYDMPRNLYSPTCLHALYDSGCGVARGTYAANGTARRRLDRERDRLSPARWRSTRRARWYSPLASTPMCARR